MKALRQTEAYKSIPIGTKIYGNLTKSNVKDVNILRAYLTKTNNMSSSTKNTTKSEGSMDILGTFWSKYMNNNNNNNNTNSESLMDTLRAHLSKYLNISSSTTTIPQFSKGMRCQREKNTEQNAMDDRLFSSRTSLVVEGTNWRDKFPRNLTMFNKSFSFVRHVGKGAYGDVALYAYGSVSYTIKCTEIDEQAIVQRFDDAYCNAIPLRHISFLDGHGSTSNDKYFIMPEMDGTLGDFIRGPHKLDMSLPEHRSIVTQICNIVKNQLLCMYKHTNIPYLDLKDENVLYRCVDNSIQIYVADIGSLHMDKDNNTIVSTYPPPECNKSGYIILQKETDHISKLSWAVGILFLSFVGLVGCPFRGEYTTAGYMDIVHTTGNDFSKQMMTYYSNRQHIEHMQKKLEVYFGQEIGDLLHPDPTKRTMLTINNNLTCWKGTSAELGTRKEHYRAYEKQHLESLLIPYKEWVVAYSRNQPDLYYFGNERTHKSVFTIKEIYDKR